MRRCPGRSKLGWPGSVTAWSIDHGKSQPARAGKLPEWNAGWHRLLSTVIETIDARWLIGCRVHKVERVALLAVGQRPVGFPAPEAASAAVLGCKQYRVDGSMIG